MVGTLPQLHGRPLVTDGGLETDLIFHHGVDLPEFAAFPLLDSAEGRRLLAAYYDGYAELARTAGAGLMLETPTWRSNPDWGAELGFTAADLHRVNVEAVEFVRALGDGYADLADVVISGAIGPRGDGYVSAGAVDPVAAEAYHRPQLEAFAAARADLATAYTLTETGEAIGIVRAARAVGLPVAVSFTVETDGRLVGGTSLAEAIEVVDEAAAPDYFLINCAHPEHVARGLDVGGWTERIVGLRCNASTQSHAELDGATELDDGDLEVFAAGHRNLRAAFPALTILGGCCGTDVRHVAALWAAAPFPAP